jgi:hypothetical protein
LNITTVSIIIVSTTTVSITTVRIITVTTTIKYMTLKKTLSVTTINAECCYAEYSIVLLLC